MCNAMRVKICSIDLAMLVESAPTIQRPYKERADFERLWGIATKDWAWGTPAYKFKRNPDEPDEYAHSWTRSAWLAWRLRAETFDLSNDHPPQDDDISAVTFWLPKSAERREALAATFEFHVERTKP